MMKRPRILLLVGLITFAITFFSPPLIGAQQGLSPAQIQQLIQSGKLTPGQIRQLQKSGQLTPEQLQKTDKPTEPGTLSPAEIEAGRRFLEKKKKERQGKVQNSVFLRGNVLRPGQYEYKPGMRVLDLLPDRESLNENTFFEYAMVKRYQIDEKKAAKVSIESFTEAGEKIQMIPFDLGRLLFYKDETQNILLMPRDEIYVYSKNMMEVEVLPDIEKALETPTPEVLQIFGHKFFRGVPSTFAPIETIPISNDYIIGSGDEINVFMWGRLDATHSLEVDKQGIISFPKIGPLRVGGLNFGEVKELIRRKTEAITGVNTHVSLGKLRTIQVFLLGEVKNPGVYTISSLSTVTNALLSSGGPTNLGSLRKIQIKRKGKKVAVIDFYDLLLKGDNSADAQLMPGDVVFVPQVGPMVSVTGNVNRPAIYELKDNKTLPFALALAANLKPSAYNQRIQIERSFQNRFQIVLDISYAELQQKMPFMLQDGDLVRVFPILAQPANAVYLYGNVQRPGQYAYKSGLRILDIVPNLKSLKKNTNFDYALIKRYRIEDMTPELIPFDLGGLLIQNDQMQNIQLMPLDEIHVFNKYMFKDREYADIQGEVRKPGRYYIDEMRIKDLILKAGDLTDSAYLQKGELIRTKKDQSKVTLYFNISAALSGNPQHNLLLQDKDRMIVHSIWEKEFKAFVTIDGEVKKVGQYVLTDSMRLKDLFFRAGLFTRDVYMELGHLYRTDWRTKEVTIHTFNPEKALAGDTIHNLLIEDLDSVFIHSIWEFREKYTVSIKGQIRNPGDYPYASNMTVKDLLLVAGNVKGGAYLDAAELVRYDIIDGKKVQTSIVNFNVDLALKKDPSHNLTLAPLDVITVKEIPEWLEKKRSVTVTGEVFFPGTYQIRKDERLSSIIERAGGHTEEAYLRGAVFTRESVRKIQQERMDDLLTKMEIQIAREGSSEIQAALSAEDLAARQQGLTGMQMLIEKLKASKASGRVVVALLPPKTLRRTKYDLLLENGDAIHVPHKINTINILGAVYNPTTLILDEDRPNLKYYLAQVGGPTENAEEKHMYIIRADGTVSSKQRGTWTGASWSQEKKRWGFWDKFEATKLYPGDTVLVPEKVARPAVLRDLKDISQILYQIAVTAGITFTQIF